MSTTERSLYDLLPVVHRLRDSAAGDPLRALLQLLDQEVGRVEANVAELYDDWFIETCSEWVVPYIGDLLGVRHLLTIDDPAFTQRAYVANTIAYRRRKGTAGVLGQLAGDLTGWPALVVEMFEQLVTTQHVNHVRLHAPATAGVRDTVALQDAATPFETLRRTADVRHIDNGRGLTNIPNVGVFLWRMQAFPLDGVTSRAVDTLRFTFDPLGASRPLFALRDDIALPLSRLGLHRHLDARYGDDIDPASLVVAVDDVVVDRADIVVADLSDAPGAPGSWCRGAPAGKVAVDPQLGRIAFASAPAGAVSTHHAVGAPGDLGGGPYDQREALAAHLDDVRWQIGVTTSPTPGDPQLVGTLADAVSAWNAQPAGTHGLIVLLDSATYTEDLDTGAARIAIPAGSRLVIACGRWPLDEADEAGAPPVRHTGRIAAGHGRAHVHGAIEVVGSAPAGSPDPGSLTIAGVLLEGGLTVVAGNLGALNVVHATLAPGACTFTVADNPELTITFHRSITGPLAPGAAADSLALRECIVDGAVDGRDVVVDSSTVLGPLAARTLEATSALLVGLVTVERRQVGCVRYSYLPEASLAPRRFRCQPDHHAPVAGVVPSFASTTFGAPDFAVLRAGCSTAITEGAEGQTEMGAWRFLHAPQRLRNLRGALDEYLRFGLEVGASLTDGGVA